MENILSQKCHISFPLLSSTQYEDFKGVVIFFFSSRGERRPRGYHGDVGPPPLTVRGCRPLHQENPTPPGMKR